jgi:hypothetical protein
MALDLAATFNPAASSPIVSCGCNNHTHVNRIGHKHHVNIAKELAYLITFLS